MLIKEKIIQICLTASAAVMALSSCHNEIEIVSLGINDYYYLPRMKKLRMETAYEGEAFRWFAIDSEGNDSLVSTARSYTFLKGEEGEYHLRFEIDMEGRTMKHSFPIFVVHEEVEYSPYTANVYEYRPAPGQFVNTMPMYSPGDTEKDMVRKAKDALLSDEMITLGAYGGYVTFGFDHTVCNTPGQMDFMIKGNAFYSDLPEYEALQGGSSEPGIVMVSVDSNGNGVPDDEWYELAGSEYYKSTTLKNYRITYSRPQEGREPVPDKKNQIADLYYIPWTDNHGGSGYVAKNTYHTQDYFPAWIDDDTMTFSGSLLPQNGVDESHRGTYFVLYAYPWGYVDNQPNRLMSLNCFNIDWAVDGDGNPVHLDGVDFIRVYTGVNQYCGWLGETSTEVLRATDLHIDNDEYLFDQTGENNN